MGVIKCKCAVVCICVIDNFQHRHVNTKTIGIKETFVKFEGNVQFALALVQKYVHTND